MYICVASHVVLRVKVISSSFMIWLARAMRAGMSYEEFRIGNIGRMFGGNREKVSSQIRLSTGWRAASALVTYNERGLKMKEEQSAKTRGLGGTLCILMVMDGSPRVGLGGGGGSSLPGLGLGLCCGVHFMSNASCMLLRRWISSACVVFSRVYVLFVPVSSRPLGKCSSVSHLSASLGHTMQKVWFILSHEVKTQSFFICSICL